MSEQFSLHTCQRINEIPASEWDACQEGDHPFTRHAFLNALEESGCATAETGWMPYHLILKQGDDICAVAPMYVKGHSQGEYVFDHGWADAYERAGGRYYPKLQLSIPFSPVTGPRFLAPQGPDQMKMKMMLAEGAKEVAAKLGLSSVHTTFMQEQDLNAAEEMDYHIRVGEQFHWVNEGYQSFDDFLSRLSSRKRKNIRKERRAVEGLGLEFENLTGNTIEEHHWDAFYEFYMDTGSRKWGRPYLNRTFFSLLKQAMGDNILLFMVKREGRYIAGALNLFGSECLYGRYWGCIEDHPFLHFETCYYKAIDFAIEKGIGRVEAGAQGPHKLARGYLPVKTMSAHWMQDPGFHDAVGDFLEAESLQMDAEINYLKQHSPFKKS